MTRHKMAPGVTATDIRLGRVARFDERSRKFSIRTVLDAIAPTEPRSYTWTLANLLNQLQTPRCTGFSTAHELAAKPVPLVATPSLADRIYTRAQQLDEWAGEDYEGSSVLGAMKAATEMGFYREYRWAFSLADALLALGYHGPIILGINWYESMFDPDDDGRLRVEGEVAGGHAILANRIDVRRRRVWMPNSWGASFGIGGYAWLSFEDFDRLRREDGEVAVPVSRLKGPT